MPRGAIRRRQRGLTLVEVLLVVVIMGVLGAVVVLTVPPRASASEKAALAFAGEVAGLSDRAITGARTIGLAPGSASGTSGLTLHAYANGDWRQEGAVPLAEGVDVRLTPGDEALAPDEPSGKTLLVYRPPGERETEPKAPPPPVTFGPTGEVTPFTALFTDGRDRWTVTVDGTGEAEAAPDA